VEVLADATVTEDIQTSIEVKSQRKHELILERSSGTPDCHGPAVFSYLLVSI
jgi:hypothetical protein